MVTRRPDLVGRLRATPEWPLGIFLLLAATALGAVLRSSLFGTPNNDIVNYDQPWLHTVRSGGFHALGGEFSDYSPPYIYYLWAANAVLRHVAGDELLIKLGPIVFDFVTAFFVYKLVRLRYPTGLDPVYAYVAVLFAPTVCLNSAYWGQSDSVWTAAVAACVYFALRGRSTAALASWSIGYAFKQQAVFLLPFLVVLAWKRRLRWRDFLLAPAIYLLAIAPAAIAGRSFADLVEIYYEQARKNAYHLTLHAANVYQWLPDRDSVSLRHSALVWAGVAIGMATVAVARARWRPTDPHLVALATASVLVCPFVLPQMHERYFYAADVLSIVLAFYRHELFVVAVGVQLCSLFSYWPFLWGSSLIPLQYVALGELVVVVLLLRHVVGWISRPEPAPA